MSTSSRQLDSGDVPLELRASSKLEQTMSKFAPHRSSASNPRATSSTVCQKCLGRGHYTYQCKDSRPYISRPSRTQQLENAKALDLKAKAKPSVEVPEEFKTKSGVANRILETREKERQQGQSSEKQKGKDVRKRGRSRKSDSDSGSDSASDSGSGSDSDSSSGSDSDSSRSSSSSSDSERSRKRRRTGRRSRRSSRSRSPED